MSRPPRIRDHGQVNTGQGRLAEIDQRWLENFRMRLKTWELDRRINAELLELAWDAIERRAFLRGGPYR